MNIKYKVKSILPYWIRPIMIRHQYYKKTKKKLNLKNPQTYNEKIQWCKLYDCTNIKTELTDKILVRKWVEQVIGAKYLIPTYGPIDGWNNANDIDFKKLPNQFVLKTNHGSGGNIIVKDKNKLNIENTRKTINSWLKYNFAYSVNEMHYKNIVPKVYCEKLMFQEGENDLPDYKFFCFDGKVYCCYTMIDYTCDHNNGKLGFFDRDYKLMPYYRKDFQPITEQLEKPQNYELMISLAEKLSANFSHVRVDFYNINGKIYFGEMTFTNASGYCNYEPDEFDEILGRQWNLDITKKIKCK